VVRTGRTPDNLNAPRTLRAAVSTVIVVVAIVVASAAVALGATTLSAPKFTLTAGPGSLKLNAFSAVNHATGYQAERCDATGTVCQTPITVTTAGYTFTGLTGGTTYTVKLQTLGNGTTYLTSAWRAKSGVPQATPLTAPVFTLSAGPGALTVNPFSPVPNASGYQAQRCNATGGSCATAVKVTTSGTTFSGLTSGTTYTVKLTATGDGTVYANSPTASQTGVPLTTTLATPNLVLTAGPGSLTIGAFTAVPNASGYRYQVCDASGANCAAVVAVTTAGTTIAGLVGGTTYTVLLTAIGDGTAYANSAPATTHGVPQATPLGTPALTLTPGSGSLAINAFAPVPNAVGYSYQVCDAMGANCAAPTSVTTAGTTISGLVNGTTYTVRLVAVGDGSVWANSPAAAVIATPAAAGATGGVPLIIDTDMYSDAGDAGAMATAFGLQLKGEAKVIATVVNTRTDRPAVTPGSWKCVAAIAQFYGSGSMLLGSDTPINGTTTSSPDWADPCGALAAAGTPTPDTAVNTYRKALVSQADHSVVIASIGYFENLQALLQSPGDAISPLSGAQLVTLKVKSLVIMGGCFPSCSGENNLIGNPAAAQYVAANWPTKMIWSGYEVGDAIHTGQSITGTHPANSPVRAAHMAYVGANNWIYSYDLTAVYHAVRPSDPSMSESAPGTVTVTAQGGDSFAAGAGNSVYLILNNATALDTSIETLLDTLPPLPPGPLPNDTFDTNTLNPSLWTTSSTGSSVTAVNQQLEIAHPAGSWTNGALVSAQPFDMTGHAIQVQLKRAANGGQSAPGLTGGETTVTLQRDGSHYADMFVGGGGLAAYVNAGSGESNITSTWIPYNATSMQWLRIREVSGILYFEYAAGATGPGTWTTFAHIADPFPPTAVSLKLAAGSDLGTADTAIFDNLSSS
jgi:hypothetical protein